MQAGRMGAYRVACYNPWDFSRSDSAIWRPTPRAVSPLQPVTVQCEEAQMVITVHRDLSGMGQLIKAAALSLGPAACWYTSLNTVKNMVTFAAGLHECGRTLQVRYGVLIYTLYNRPLPASNPTILRTGPAVIPIECHYPRKDNVSSRAIKPTWVPFNSTLSAKERLDFSLHLMNDRYDWSAERPSNGFQLGEVMHIQADVSTGNHLALRLFVDSCVATLGPDRDSSPRYAVIDFNGSDDTISTFISPRPRQDMLNFMVDVFRFAGDTNNLIYITCHLKVTSADQAPDPLNKACSFNKAGNVWSPTGNCGPLAQTRSMNSLDSWPGRCFQREMPSRNGELSNALCLLNGVAMSSS
uniref:Zona pellucida sperm-binding protein 3 n=1 Tax=Terrapene triunguis TaxID=2587831 RepID=A0A674ICP8_9SAUR